MKDNFNVFNKFDKDWALVTAGTIDNFNTMTISWGEMGIVWGKKVITIFIRPDRYTFKFLKENDDFTVSFYDEKYRKALGILGTLSGKNVDKVKQVGFEKLEIGNSITFKEAKETYLCHKIFMQQMNYENVPDVAKKIYQNGIEPHYIIIGEIVEVK